MDEPVNQTQNKWSFGYRPGRRWGVDDFPPPGYSDVGADWQQFTEALACWIEIRSRQGQQLRVYAVAYHWNVSNECVLAALEDPACVLVERTVEYPDQPAEQNILRHLAVM